MCFYTTYIGCKASKVRKLYKKFVGFYTTYIGCKDMEGGIIIDDVASNLESSNASLKICFGKVYPWNEKWEGIRAYDWLEVSTMLL